MTELSFMSGDPDCELSLKDDVNESDSLHNPIGFDEDVPKIEKVHFYFKLICASRLATTSPATLNS